MGVEISDCEIIRAFNHLFFTIKQAVGGKKFEGAGETEINQVIKGTFIDYDLLAS